MHRRLTAPTIAFCLAGLTLACGPEKGTTSPESGKTQEEIDAERKAAAEQARTLGLVDLANQDLANGRYVSAKQRADEALEQDPNSADAYSVLGAAQWRAGDLTASTEAFRKAVELDPKNFGAVLGLGRNLQASGQHEEAIALQQGLIEGESEGFTEVACDDEGACEMGWCEPESKMCKPPMQAGPRLVKLWSEYLLLEVDSAETTTDQIFTGVGADEGILAVVQAYAAFIRPLVGKGDLVQVEGELGETDLELDLTSGNKHGGVVVGDEYARAVFYELQNESRISTEMAATLGLESIGKVKPLGMDSELDLVLIPQIKVGEMVIKQVPALVQDLSHLASIGEVPGLLLGRQVLQRFGAVHYDFPNKKVELMTSAPAVPADAGELPLMFLDLRALQIPALQVGIDGADHRFWVWMGGVYPSALAVSAKHYLKSNHRPLEVAEVDDPANGFEMAYLDSLDFGGASAQGVGAYVLMNTPPDAGLSQVVDGSGYELGGYLNGPIMGNLDLTMSYPEGRAWVRYVAPPAVE